MANSTLWWLLAGGAVGVELLTGTFYLLMVAIGLAAGALAAHLGLGSTAQIAAAALVGGLCTVAWHLQRSRHPKDAAANANRDLHMDIGEHVQVVAWEADGLARVHYRGAQWQARLQPGATALPGRHVVVALNGNTLVLAPAP